MPQKYNPLLAKLIQEVPPKSNFTAVVVPFATDDASKGYSPGSSWTNLNTDRAYVCLDSTVGAAVWVETTAGALGGEANTTSNIGTAGVGIFKQKAGVDFELKKINAGSAKITITDDVANNEVDVDVVTGVIANSVCVGNDARLSDARVPSAHETSHEALGSDELDFDQLADGTTYKKLLATEQTDIGLNTTHRTSDGSDHSFIDQSVVNGASPALLGTNITAIPAVNVEVSEIGTATYDDIQDLINNIMSAGRISGGVISDDGDGTITVSAGTGLIKITDSCIGVTKSFDWAASTTVSLTDNSVNYIYVDYNAGNPIIASTTDFTTINKHSEFGLGRVYRAGTALHIVNNGQNIYDFSASLHDRFLTLYGFQRASEAMISATGTRNFAITAGVFYLGVSKILTTALNTSVADTFSYYYRDGIGGWTKVAAQTQINNTNYDDGDGTLGVLTSNRYGVHWIYLQMNSSLSVVYGQGNYTLTLAESANPLSSIPPILRDFSILVGKIIIQQNGATFISILSPFTTKFSPSSIQNHNDLSNIQGGAANDYYHLTTANVTKLNGIESLADVTDAINIASSIVGVDDKATPVDADSIGLIDSVAANVLKELTWANVKATLKTYFDTLYNLYVHPNHSGDVTSLADGAQTIANKQTMSATSPITLSNTPTVVAAAAPVIAIPAATNAIPGHATAAQITKLEGIETSANLYVHPNHSGDVTSLADGATTIAAGAVDIAMLANGTDGELITWDAAGAPAVVAVGTATHVLTSNGVGVAPTFQASAGGSSLVSIWLPAESCYLPATNPAALVEETGATVYAGHSHLAFDDTTSEHAVWRIPMPDYDGGNIVVTGFTKIGATPAGAVTLQFDILTIGLATSEAFDAAVTVDTTVNLSFSLDTTELLTDVMIATATIDPANVAADDLLIIELARDVATDTLVGDGELLGIMLEYTRA